MRPIMRNKGFENGDLSFWISSGDGSVAIDATEKYAGSYSCELTSSAGTKRVYITHNDYIVSTPGGVIDFSVWIKGVAGDTFSMRAIPYDSDRNAGDVMTLKSIVCSGSWEQLQTQYIPLIGEDYIRIYLRLDSVLGAAIVYVDSFDAYIAKYDEMSIRKLEIANLSDKTSSGDTSGDEYRLYGFRSYYAEIDVTSVTGTTPTCDVTVCETDEYDNERVLGTFTQFNAVTDQRVGIAAPIGKGMYVKYVMGGTVTDCDFKVSVIGVR